VLNGPKKVADGSMNTTLSTKIEEEKRTSSEHTHEPINMNHICSIHLSYLLDEVPPNFNLCFFCNEPI
jgi:hypothetical protein